MAKDDIMVLSDYGGTSLERRTRIGKNGPGKARYTVTIKSEPILVQTDPAALSAGTAHAIQEHLRRAVGAISEQVKPATMKARLSAQKALVNGSNSGVVKRYSGGKTGTRAPARSDRYFNDSGRFIEGIAARLTKNGFVINVPGNRFDPSTFNGGEAAMQTNVIEKLRQFVPEFFDAGRLLDVLSVQKAMRDSVKNALQKTTERGVELKKQLMGQLFDGVMAVVRMAG